MSYVIYEVKVYDDGTKYWYLNGKRHRVDGPACEYVNGTKEWWLDGKLHRINGPACEWANGTKSWWLDGRRHRIDGPAIEWPNGTKEWWFNGKKYSKQGYNKELQKRNILDFCENKIVVEIDGKKYKLSLI